jgi:hypothetical protein
MAMITSPLSSKATLPISYCLKEMYGEEALAAIKIMFVCIL